MPGSSTTPGRSDLALWPASGRRGAVADDERTWEVRLRFLQDARAALLQLDHAVKTAAAAGSGTIGRLSIGIMSSVATGYLRELIEVYRSRHPDVGIQILESASADNVAAVRKRQLDVAFIMDTTDASGCETLPFGPNGSLWCSLSIT